MIRPPGIRAAFSEAADGDIRNVVSRRNRLSNDLGIETDWALVTQVHGSEVVLADHPGDLGRADAVWTRLRGLPVAVFTADCFAVVLESESAVGVAHAGWRGVKAGVVGLLRSEMTSRGHPPTAAAVGPGIGPCCFEVGPEVASLFPEHTAETTWGTTSVDLAESIRSELAGLEVWMAGRCTFHEEGWFSHRRQGTPQRLAAVAWVV